MNVRARFLAACLLSTGALVAASPAGAADKVISTQSAEQPAPGTTSYGTAAQPASGGKTYSSDSAGPPPVVMTTPPAEQQPLVSDPGAEAVKARFAQRFPEMDVAAVRRTPYGLFEVQVGMDLVYTDENVSWVMQGPLIDAATRRDVTSENQEKIGAVPFDQLPLDLAVKQVRGNGARKVAIFEDPNCGYCKQLRHTLEGQTNLTIYTFLYPILAPDSRTKASEIWCADKPAAAWDDWMLHGKMPAVHNCDAPVDKVLDLGRKLMVNGTPTLFFADGTRVSGALPLDELLARLDRQPTK